MKICLCGSTRFMDQFHAANVALSLAGHTVYSVATSTRGNFEPTADQKIVLDAVHLSKIEESDAIMVVGHQPDGSMYLGDSTKREIAFARMRDKHVYFFTPGQEIGGPNTEFTNDLKAAVTTEIEREEARKREAERRRAFMDSFQAGGVLETGGTSEDSEEMDHSDDPEAPTKSREETH